MTSDALRDRLASRLAPIGQEGVLRFWSDIDDDARASLASEIDALDMDLVGRLAARLRPTDGPPTASAALEPAPILSLAEIEGERRARARETGEAAIRAGKVAAMIVAGGQASRLGIDIPKGAFPIGPVSGKTLYQILLEKVLAASRRYGVAIPLVVLTSDGTHEATRTFLEEHGRFGLPEDGVELVRQASIPAFDPGGRMMLRSRSGLFLSPDGHGGSLAALYRSGALDRLRADGREILSYIQVDNPLALPVDPVFIGLHIEEGSEISSKIAERTDPEEKVGVFAYRDGRLGVVEYSELSGEDQSARDPDGKLRFRGGNLAMHAWSLDFLHRLREDGLALPFHMARKKVPAIDDEGRPVSPEAPNGVKFEQFIFDAIPLARKGIVVEVSREEEFQPVKSAAGADTPEDARRAMVRLHARWLEGVTTMPRDARGEPVHPVEVSPLLALDADELAARAPAGLEVTGPLYLAPDALEA